MSYECINPEVRDQISEIMKSSVEEVAAFDVAGPGDILDVRLHWNCCPACRHEFPRLPPVLERAAREMERVFADSLLFMRNYFLAEKQKLLGASSDASAYPEIIAKLAGIQEYVQNEFQHALCVAPCLYPEALLNLPDPYEQPLLPYCREFVSSLEPGVQRFVVAATLCFELIRPMWERVGLERRGRTHEEVMVELNAKLERHKQGVVDESAQGSTESLEERLQRAITESGLEPKTLWEIIESAARASVSAGGTVAADRVSQAWATDFDDFADSMKAGQMETIRLISESSRKAAEYEPDIIALVGSLLYSRLNETTQQLLKQAERQYHLNSQEPNYLHGAVLTMAHACEAELMVRLAWPFAKDLLDSGAEVYPPVVESGKRPERPLILGGRVQEKNMTLGSIAWHLKHNPDFREKVRVRGFDVDAVSKDAMDVTRARDRAAHKPICERTVADDLRRLILCHDGILSHLHPAMVSSANS